MLNNKKILGIITARGGSKGVPGKNIRALLGKPLIAYTIDAAKNSALLDRCVVSTDSQEIADIAARLGGDVPFIRPDELSTDSALALDVLTHAINALREKGEEYDYVMMLQPTSPMRRAQDIDACITMAVESDADSVFSMKQVTDFAPQKLKIIENGVIRPYLNNEEGQSAPRHEGPEIYKRNCAIYLTKTSLIEQGDQFGKKSLAYIMPQERSVDINDPIDFEFAEFWMQRHIDD